MISLVRATSGAGRRVAVNGVDIYFEECGAGDVILLLHGGIMDHQSWGNQIPALSMHFRVIAPDTRGHGRSSDSDDPFTFHQFADDMAGLLRQLNVSRADVVGFSDGGATALVLAMRYPELVERVVLLGTPYSITNYPPGTLDFLAAATLEALHPLMSPAFREVVEKAQSVYPSVTAFDRFWQKLVNDLWLREPSLSLGGLSGIKAPTLILHSENEHFFEFTHSEDMRRAIPGATLKVISGATHTAAQEEPAQVNALILDFLRSPDE
jgi:pimeloyl-ACP methyl ester carboxylesterase